MGYFSHLTATLAASLWAISAGTGNGAELPVPTGPVILEVNGAVARTNYAGSAQFDREMLLALGQVDLETVTPWSDGSVRFTGVLVRDMLDHVEAEGETIRAVALNDYSIEIPVQDFYDYDAILALDKDGKPMSVRDRGPIWVIYPWSQHDELRNEIYHARSIWQLRLIEILK